MTSTAGCRFVELFDEPTATPFPVLVMYPSDTTERPEKLGPYSASVALDAPFPLGPLPLVIVSHGTGGSHLTHCNLAAHLARHGYLVVVPEHPRNNRNNNELAGTAVNLANRPRHIRSAIDGRSPRSDPVRSQSSATPSVATPRSPYLAAIQRRSPARRQTSSPWRSTQSRTIASTP